MKIVMVLLLAVVACGFAICQTAPPPDRSPDTNIEAFLARKGTVIATDTMEVGEAIPPGEEANELKEYVSFQAIAAHTPGKEQAKMKGFRCQQTIEGSERYRPTSVELGYIDLTQAEELSKALDDLTTLATKLRGTPPVKSIKKGATFRAGCLTIGFEVFEFKGESDPAVRAFVSVSRGAEILGDLSYLTKIKALLDKGINWLKAQ